MIRRMRYLRINELNSNWRYFGGWWRYNNIHVCYLHVFLFCWSTRGGGLLVLIKSICPPVVVEYQHPRLFPDLNFSATTKKFLDKPITN